MPQALVRRSMLVACLAAAAYGVPSMGNEQAGEVIDMLPGIVKPGESAELAPPVDGVLGSLEVAEGETVAAGTTLAVVDREFAEATLRQAEFEAGRTAAVRLAASRVAVARQYLARIEQAFAKQAASELELDEARGRVEESLASLAEAEEQVAAARIQLVAAQAQHANHEVRSPIAGEVVRIDARVGETVQRTTPIAMVVDLETLRADLYVPTRLLSDLEVGRQYTLAAEAPIDRDLVGTLIHREPLIDAASDTFRCRFVIDNHDRDLPAGFAVRLRHPGPTAPSRASIADAR